MTLPLQTGVVVAALLDPSLADSSVAVAADTRAGGVPTLPGADPEWRPHPASVQSKLRVAGSRPHEQERRRHEEQIRGGLCQKWICKFKNN
jgi:hypothetical protein